MTTPVVPQTSIAANRKPRTPRLNFNPRTTVQLEQLRAAVKAHFEATDRPLDGRDERDWREDLPRLAATVAQREACGLGPDEVGRVYQNGVAGHVQLDATGERKIGRAAMQVWRHLIDLRGPLDLWRQVSLARVALDLQMPRRTVKWALARLRACGLVDSDAHRVHGAARHHGRVVKALAAIGAPADPSWSMVLHVRALGGVDTIRGRAVAWVPPATIAWCAAARGHGGYRHGAANRVKIAPPPVSVAADTLSTPPTSAGLPGQDCPPKTPLSDCSCSPLSVSASQSQRENPAAPDLLPVRQRAEIDLVQPQPHGSGLHGPALTTGVVRRPPATPPAPPPLTPAMITGYRAWERLGRRGYTQATGWHRDSRYRTLRVSEEAASGSATAAASPAG